MKGLREILTGGRNFIRTFWEATSALIVAIIILIYVFCFNELIWEKSYLGLNKLTEIFKIPLGLGGLSIALFTLKLSYLRTKRLQDQIEISQINNFRSNYIELAKNVTPQQKPIIDINLIGNLSNIYPMLNRGEIQMNASIVNILSQAASNINAIATIGNTTSFQYKTGFNLLMSFEYCFQLNDHLTLIHQNQNYSGIEYLRSELIRYARFLLHLIEFVSQFEKLMSPDAIMRSVAYLDNLSSSKNNVEEVSRYLHPSTDYKKVRSSDLLLLIYLIESNQLVRDEDYAEEIKDYFLEKKIISKEHYKIIKDISQFRINSLGDRRVFARSDHILEVLMLPAY